MPPTITTHYSIIIAITITIISITPLAVIHYRSIVNYHYNCHYHWHCHRHCLYCRDLYSCTSVDHRATPYCYIT